MMTERGTIDIAVPPDVAQMVCSCGGRAWRVLVHDDGLVWGMECSHCRAGMLLDEGWLHGGQRVAAAANGGGAS